MARILLHTLVFAPDGVSTAYLMTDLARQLSSSGHTVTVLTTTPHYNLAPGALERQPMRRVWPGLLYRSDVEGIPVFHVVMPRKGAKVSARIADYVRFHTIALLATWRVGRYDIVFAPSPPLSIGVVAWLQARLRGAKAVYNVQEIFPDFLVSQGLIRSSRLIAFLRRMERFVYRRCDAIVTISPWFTRTIAARGALNGRLFTVPNSVDAALYRPMARDTAFSREHGLNDRFVILYGGNIGLSQDWTSVLHAAEHVRDLPIVFVIVGGGAAEEMLRAEVTRRALDNVRLLGYQPRERMPEINASSDLGTIPMKTGGTTDTFPSKIYTIMACARPVLVSADDDSELKWLVETAACGRVVPPDDPAAYLTAVRRAFAEREALRPEGERGRAYVEKSYSKEAVGKSYDELLRSLAGH